MCPRTVTLICELLSSLRPRPHAGLAGHIIGLDPGQPCARPLRARRLACWVSTLDVHVGRMDGERMRHAGTVNDKQHSHVLRAVKRRETKSIHAEDITLISISSCKGVVRKHNDFLWETHPAESCLSVDFSKPGYLLRKICASG